MTNTPAVNPKTGRIYVTAAGPKDGTNYTGRLYGLDILDGEIQFLTGLVNGSRQRHKSGHLP